MRSTAPSSAASIRRAGGLSRNRVNSYRRFLLRNASWPIRETKQRNLIMPVPYQKLEYRGDGLYYRDGAPFTGTAAYLEDGWSESEADYRDGLLSGWEREWHGPGVLAREAQCEYGARHGRFREWDDEGRLIEEAHYEYGVRVSGKRWDADGKLLEDFQIGETDPMYNYLRLARAAEGPPAE